ncbi:MAG: esterase family protein [Chitinispirillaceae bacterium]|nr:esterase family protein [Chitinispirillaceae bacterium]
MRKEISSIVNFILGLCLIPVLAYSTDNANLPVPLAGWDAVKSVPHGEVKKSLSYPTRNNGQQLYSIWLPPGYSTDKKYPVLYIHHGLGDDQTTWINGSKGKANNILDNYLADKKIVPMIVVFPDNAVGDNGSMGNFAPFGDLLFNDLIPYIDKTYSTLTDPLNRAIGGLSMGGGQALNYGLPHTDVFNWIGAFAPAVPNAPEKNVPDPSVIKANVRYIFIGVGTADNLTKGSADQYHAFFDSKGITHTFRYEQGLGHDWTCFNRCFYNFVPHIFTGTVTGITLSRESLKGKAPQTRFVPQTRLVFQSWRLMAQRAAPNEGVSGLFFLDGRAVVPVHGAAALPKAPLLR